MIGLGPGSLPEMHKYSTLSLCRGARLLPAAGKLGGGGDKLRLNHPCQQGACMALSFLEEDGTQAFAHSLLGNLDFFPWLAGFEAFSDTRWGKETTKI